MPPREGKVCGVNQLVPRSPAAVTKKGIINDEKEMKKRRKVEKIKDAKNKHVIWRGVGGEVDPPHRGTSPTWTLHL